MNNARQEAASWRVWYRLKESGPCTKENLMANCGSHTELMNQTLDGLTAMGQIEQTAIEPPTFELHDEKARMMQVFPTLENEL